MAHTLWVLAVCAAAAERHEQRQVAWAGVADRPRRPLRPLHRNLPLDGTPEDDGRRYARPPAPGKGSTGPFSPW
eukprot:549584-Prorocentrum_minimum.AAC.1